jgi:hypothetical protein
MTEPVATFSPTSFILLGLGILAAIVIFSGARDMPSACFASGGMLVCTCLLAWIQPRSASRRGDRSPVPAAPPAREL